MTVDELREVAALGESDQREFKKTTGDLKGGMETLCGFLNGRGGQVYFGILNDGKVVGLTISDATLREVAQELSKLEPLPTIAQFRIPTSEGKEVLMLETTDRDAAPYVYCGRPFHRVGSTTSQMPQAAYERRLLDRYHSRQRWENLIAERFTVADLDDEEILRTIREATDASTLESSVTSPLEALRKFHLLAEDRPLQAAVVAFAREPLPDYPQCNLRLARFRGVTKSEFLDQRQLSGHAFLLFREADLFLRRHLPVRGRFESGVSERIDEPLFPPLALREALVNAICHRDYSIYGGSIHVAIFDDRVEVISTGTLPFGLTIADLTREHESRSRNPLLAELFHRRGLAERWGRGTQEIVELCRAAGHPEPEFEERAGEVVVRFWVAGYVPPHRIMRDLSDRQRRILHVLRDGSKKSSKEIRSELGTVLPPTTLRDELNMLRTLGMVDGSGHARGAKWWLKHST
jgi:ATP-dependent DNA helicase RecG